MRRLILCAVISALALFSGPADAQITYTTRAADSAAAWRSSNTETVRRAAFLRMLAQFDSANRNAARERFIRDSVLAKIPGTAPAPTPVPEPPPPVVTPPSGVQPWASDDFSTYTSKAQLFADPRYKYTPENPDRISLDAAVSLSGSGQSMRYDWPNRINEGTTDGYDGYCTSYRITRAARMPDSARHVWVEVYVRTSPGFTVRAPESWLCKSAPDYKHLFITFGNPGWGEWRIQTPGWKWNIVWPGADYSIGQNEGVPLNRILNTYWSTGAWYRLRAEVRLSSCSTCADGISRAWVDDYKLLDISNAIIPRSNFDVLQFGANMNQGPGAPQSMWWGKWSIWITNPGW